MPIPPNQIHFSNIQYIHVCRDESSYLCFAKSPKVSEHQRVVDGGGRDEDVLLDRLVLVPTKVRWCYNYSIIDRCRIVALI